MLRLTERLAALGEQDESTELLQPNTSICHYLRKVLNTRKGSVSINPNMGMPAMNLREGISSDDDRQALLTLIESTITTADPRVICASVTESLNDNITVLIKFTLLIDTAWQSGISMLGYLHNDNTFELELA